MFIDSKGDVESSLSFLVSFISVWGIYRIQQLNSRSSVTDSAPYPAVTSDLSVCRREWGWRMGGVRSEIPFGFQIGSGVPLWERQTHRLSDGHHLHTSRLMMSSWIFHEFECKSDCVECIKQTTQTKVKTRRQASVVWVRDVLVRSNGTRWFMSWIVNANTLRHWVIWIIMIQPVSYWVRLKSRGSE